VIVRPTWIVVCALALGLGLAACGGSKATHKAGSEAAGLSFADSNNNGAYVQADSVTYQLQISRVLNPYGAEDSQYVNGLPAATTAPTADQEWYGVFLWAKNQTATPQTTSDKFVIVDTQGVKYYPVNLNPTVNPYAWTARTLAPLATEPGPATTAANGPTQGQLLLFKINNSAFANRPLTLDILGSSDQTLATISLDL